MLRAFVMLTTLCLVLLVGMAFVGGVELKKYMNGKMDQVVQWVNHVDIMLAPPSKKSLSQTVGEAVDQVLKDSVTETQHEVAKDIQSEVGGVDNLAKTGADTVHTDAKLPENYPETVDEKSSVIAAQETKASTTSDSPFSDQDELAKPGDAKDLTNSLTEPEVEPFDPVHYELYQAEMTLLSERTLQSLNLIDVHLGRD